MDKILDAVDKIKVRFKSIFITDKSNPKEVRQKQLRLGALILFVISIFIYISLNTDVKSQVKKNNFLTNQGEADYTTKKIEIGELAKGVSNEKLWIEEEGKRIEEVKQNQLVSNKKQEELQTYIEKNKVSKEELDKLMKDFEAQVEERLSQRIEEETNRIKEEYSKKFSQESMESKSFVKKVKIKKVGDYIPALSYVGAKLIAGVDAGVGITAEMDPDEALIRVTGKLVSAGVGADYIESNRLIGCLVIAKAIGNISSEKVRLEPVSMTCTKDKRSVIEIPIKGYIVSKGKGGIRGEVITREGDLVLKSFLAGIVGGFGNGVAQYTQAPLTVSNGLLAGGKQSAQDIATRGLGAGVSSSSDKLLDYFVKKMEQYQPVISVNEGTEVNIVFKEGFSLIEEAKNEK